MTSPVLSSPSVARVRAALAAAGNDTPIIELADAARSAKAAAEFLGCSVAQIANSLVFRAQRSGAPLLVMASGAHRVDTARLAALAGEPVEMARAAFVREHTGFAIGGVAPVGHPAPLRTLIDLALARHARIWAAAGHPNTVFELSFETLQRLTRGTPAELAERAPA
ncbi:MAG TPA: YbaK/EbsC family protein [Burkholderiales bacterium]|nr:YbaK/EbsC family protein [Burkholderiales bacterium]